jgi:hypothetical protein
VPRNVVDRLLSRLSHRQALAVVMGGGAISGLLWYPLLSGYLEWRIFVRQCRTTAIRALACGCIDWPGLNGLDGGYGS